jgi:hypothetical protein
LEFIIYQSLKPVRGMAASVLVVGKLAEGEQVTFVFFIAFMLMLSLSQPLPPNRFIR